MNQAWKTNGVCKVDKAFYSEMSRTSQTTTSQTERTNIDRNLLARDRKKSRAIDWVLRYAHARHLLNKSRNCYVSFYAYENLETILSVDFFRHQSLSFHEEIKINE